MGPNVELETEGGDIRGNRNKCEIYNFDKIDKKSNLFKMLRNVYPFLQLHHLIQIKPNFQRTKVP